MHTEREIIQAWMDHGMPTDMDGVPQFEDRWLRPSNLKSKAARWLDVRRVMSETTPPPGAIDAAISEANRLPERCVKSHRGAAIFDDSGRVLTRGHNAQPGGVMCSGTCRKHCAKICEHAEAMAIRLLRLDAPGRFRGLHMLHVKTVDGVLVPSSLPSCWQCSRQMVTDGRIETMWLFHADGWRCYTVADFHRITLETCGIHAEQTG